MSFIVVGITLTTKLAIYKSTFTENWDKSKRKYKIQNYKISFLNLFDNHVKLKMF